VISGKVDLVDRLFLADRFKLAPPNYQFPGTKLHCSQVLAMTTCPNEFLKALA
jgi:hypothetical protein